MPALKEKTIRVATKKIPDVKVKYVKQSFKIYKLDMDFYSSLSSQGGQNILHALNATTLRF